MYNVKVCCLELIQLLLILINGELEKVSFFSFKVRLEILTSGSIHNLSIKLLLDPVKSNKLRYSE